MIVNAANLVNPSQTALRSDEPRLIAERPHSGRIPSLDGLRGIAILMVLLSHGTYSLPAFLFPVLWFAGNGTLGVKIFFVLSGYLIYTLSVREAENSGWFNWRNFYIRRALRIFPCFYTYILVLIVLMGFGILNLTWPFMVSAATYSLNYRHLWDRWSIGPTDYFVVGHYWSLALEEQFYLTWPLLMLLFFKRKLLMVLSAAVVLAPFVRLLFYFTSPGSRGQLQMMFHTGFDSIAAGVLLGELLRRPRQKAWLESLASSGWIVGASITFVLVVSPLIQARLKGAYSVTAQNPMELTCLCMVVLAGVGGRRTLLVRLLNCRLLTYIGVTSYSLYVWNNLFLYSDGKMIVNVFPLNFGCLFGVALTSYYLIEKPCLRLKDRFHKGTLPLNRRSLQVGG